ncbi:centrosomal protein of 170 kDa-like isoform X3 [Gigantopelta aegis]|uniref:centrosomal protein of 170 kDa-like isoform X3 n=1 Tax=Gigantopelta aegis TaxID=1735272 RepID=UPI001B88764C|nr:centrosomal protein of 170 kDa-like isoform X3 [Gigantopelta aegis]
MLMQVQFMFYLAEKLPAVRLPFKLQEEGGGQSEDWYLVDGKCHKFRLPKTMLFLGKEECDVVVKCSSVDKRHAVITYDHYLNRFKIKDLSTKHGTFVNESRIPEQEYVTLNHMDSVQLGHDNIMIYQMEKGSKAAENEKLPPAENMPAWAVRSDLHMAECQGAHSGYTVTQCRPGCIAEQKITHTCSHNLPNDKESDFVDTHHSFAKCGHDEKLNLSNTWPRKKIRQQHAHIATVFAEEQKCVEDQDQETFAPNNGYDFSDDPHRLSCQHAMYSGEGYEPDTSQVPACTCYVNNHSASGTFSSFSDQTVSVSAQTNGVPLPRVSKSMGPMQILPPELATVKKGTPLYGQPEWWGEAEPDPGGSSSSKDSGPDSSSHTEETGSKNAAPHCDRPQCLPLGQDEQAKMEKYRTDPKYSTTYMEIPHKDTAPERDKDTPPHSMSSSISKDSLFSDASKLNTPDTPSDKVVRQGPGGEEPGHADTTGLAFTVDFGDDKKLNMSGSLSEFVPSKIRKNFRERMEKVSKPQNRDGGNHSKVEDDNDHSPMQQKRIEDIWSSSEHKAAKKMGRKSWPPHTPGTTAAKSGSRPGGSPQLTNSTKCSTVEEEKISKHNPAVKSNCRTTRVKKSPNSKVDKTQKPTQTETSSIDPANYSDPASYLLDKMFQSSTTSSENGHYKKSSELTEHDLYQESKKYDIYRQPSMDDDVVSAHSMKPKMGEKYNNKSSPEECNEKIEEIEEDKVSEAGTYTIEADVDDIDEEIARTNIDEIFGLCLDNGSLNRPVITTEDAFVVDREEVKRETIVTASFRTRGASLEVKAGSADTLEDLDTADQSEELDMSAISAQDIPKWVSQWAALANQRALKKAHSLDIPLTEVAQDVQKQKSSNGISRKRPGTGRRLPSIPSDKSPCNSEYSSRISDSSPQSTNDSTPRYENLPVSWQDEMTGKAKVVTISSQVVTHCEETYSDSTARQVSESESAGDSSFRTRSPCLDSSRTSGSMDTEVLLQDTQTVMAAMEARMASRSAKEAVNGFNHSDSQDNSDTDSNVAMVNGDDDFLKPSYFESPRQNIAKKQTPVKGSVKKSASAKPPLVKTSSVVKDNINSVRKKARSLSLDHSVISDIFNESFEITDIDSQRSDISSDNLTSSTTRGASKGKGTISMQKPNRAFQLRRTKADATIDPPRSSRSDASSTSGVTTSRTRVTASSAQITQRSTSAASTARTTSRSKSGMSGKSEVSLGAEIVKKSQQNIKFVRTDGGRHSLRSFKSNSEKTLVHIDTGRKADLKVLKSQLKTTVQGSRGLAVTGQGTGQKVQSQSQPGSRSNSPKAAERLAWKRRKEYDPRKAVADAKAKAKETVPIKHKSVTSLSSSSSASKQMMTRSSSFTNTAELSGRVRHDTYRKDSTSSTEDLNHMSQEFSNKFQKETLARAFIPVHKTFRSDRLFHSADEDESSLSFHSTQELSRGMISSLEYKSAFTTPSPKQKTPSPDKSPPSASLSSRRHTLNSFLYQDHNSLHNHVENGLDSCQSYDTLIISSIYQLSLKLKTANDRTINKLRENDRVSVTPSPIDDFLGQTATSEIPAYKSANQELAGILKNLRKLEHHQKIIDRALFPDEDTSTDVSGISHKEKQKYFQAIERINSELTGFQSIESDGIWKHSNSSEVTTPDMTEITEDEYY